MTHTGKLIKHARLKKGLSQGKVAKALGYANPQYISNIERGQCVFPVKKGKRFSKIVGIPGAHLKEVMVLDYCKWLDRNW